MRTQGPGRGSGCAERGLVMHIHIWQSSVPWTARVWLSMMFPFVSLVCRRWQFTRPSCFVQQLHYQLEPIVRSNGTLTSGSPDVEIPQLFHDQRLKQRRILVGGQKTTSSDTTEMYRTSRRIRQRFYRLMKTCELVMVVTEINTLSTSSW